MTESRKYGLFLTMAHQTLAQLPRELQEVILGNTDMQFLFRLGPPDGRTLAPGNFDPTGRMEKPQRTPYDTLDDPRDRFYTEREELARYAQVLASQPKRHLYYRHKDKPYKAQPIVTADLPLLHEELGISLRELEAWTRECVALSTAAYTRAKRDVLAEIAQRKSLAEHMPSPRVEKARQQDRAGRAERLAEIVPDIGDFKEK